MALHNYGFPAGEGIYTDMNAIRREEALDNIHSSYVDQWDWEKVISKTERTEDFLRSTVTSIVDAICGASEDINAKFPALKLHFDRNVSFVTTQELEDLYPNLSSRERENAYGKDHKTFFLRNIGDLLKSGVKHDARAPDYDDWALNGDIVIWDDALGAALEISSMGIRVDNVSLDSQLKKANCDYRRELPYHKKLLAGELPLTIGGGIGQSRLYMLLLQKAHIGEVQVSVWDDENISKCHAAGIKLL
jgi:aspartate--ammonia ligase